MGLTYEEAKRNGMGHLWPTVGGEPVIVGPVLKAAMIRGKNKYGALPTIYKGVRYASKAEAARVVVLEEWAAQQHDRFWIGQPKFRLGCPENVYVADFLVVENRRSVHVEDVKGVRTAKFKKDVRLWMAYGKCELWIITGKKTEVITPENNVFGGAA